MSMHLKQSFYFIRTPKKTASVRRKPKYAHHPRDRFNIVIMFYCKRCRIFNINRRSPKEVISGGVSVWYACCAKTIKNPEYLIKPTKITRKKLAKLAIKYKENITEATYNILEDYSILPYLEA